MTNETEPWPCPCCGYRVFCEPPWNYEICPVCGWEDDLSQLRFPAESDPPNYESLISAQLRFAWREQHNKLGWVPEERGYFRDPTWRRLDPDIDRIEISASGRQYPRPYAADRTVYYYWRQTDPRNWQIDVAEECIRLYLELSERPRPTNQVETQMLIEVIDAGRAHEQRKHIALMHAIDTSGLSLHPVGRVDVPSTNGASAPGQSSRGSPHDSGGSPHAWLDFAPHMVGALDDIAVGDRLIVLTWLVEADQTVLQMYPQDDIASPGRGVYATQSPDRPNPIGLHETVVLAVDDHRLEVTGIDAPDGAPIIDVRPARGAGSDAR